MPSPDTGVAATTMSELLVYRNEIFRLCHNTLSRVGLLTHDVSYIKSKVFQSLYGIWVQICISGMYVWAMAGQSGQNVPFWGPWPQPRFSSFLNIFLGTNGLSIPENDRKWVKNWNPEPYLLISNHIWEISIFVQFWAHSRNVPFLFSAEELGLNIWCPDSPDIGLLGHWKRPTGKSTFMRNGGKRTPYSIYRMFYSIALGFTKPPWQNMKNIMKKIIFMHKKFIFYYIRGHKWVQQWSNTSVEWIPAILMIHFHPLLHMAQLRLTFLE